MIDFSSSQKKTIAAGLTVLSFAVTLTFVAGVVWLLFRFLDLISPALMPIVMGVFLSMLFKPYYEWYLRRFRNPTLSMCLMFLSVGVPLVLILWCGGTFLVQQISGLVAAAPRVVVGLSHWASEQFPKLATTLSSLGVSADELTFFSDPAKFAHDLLSEVHLTGAYGVVALKAGAGVLHYLSTIGTMLLTLLFFVYFLSRPPVHGSDCVRELPFLKPETQRFVADQVDYFVDIVVSFFQRQVLICLIEGVLYGCGFLLVGLPNGFILGFLLGVLNLVPLLGTVACMPIIIPLAYFGEGGSLMQLILVLIVWLMGQLLDGYLITPKIQGEKTGLGYAGVIFSFLFWGIVFHSMLGLLLAIPLSAFCVVFWRALKARYIRGVI